MIAPRRLLEDNPTGLERDLLAAGVSFGSTDAARQNTLAALGLVGTAAVSASVAAAAVAASSTTLQKLGVLKLVALSTVGVAVLTPIGILAWKKFEVPNPVPAVIMTAVPHDQPAEPVPAPAPVVAEQTAEAATVEAPAPKAEARPASSGALTAELGELDRARSKLSTGDATGALAVLDDYARTYPRGRLGLEAEVLRIDALAQSGDMQSAKKRAEAFLKRHPKGVLAPRVRRYLDDPK
jgi:hypothetical protein